MSTLSKKARRWCTVAAVACLISAVAFGALYARVLQVGARLPALSLQIEESEKRLGAATTLRSLAGEAKTARSNVAKVVIQKEGVADFIEQIESAGRSIQVVVAVDSVEPQPSAVSDMEELRVVLHATGLWERTARLVALMETLPLESRVLQAVFSRSETGGGALWRADITLTALKEK